MKSWNNQIKDQRRILVNDIKINGDNNGSINNFENAVISNVNIGSPIDNTKSTFNKQKTTVGQVLWEKLSKQSLAS